MSLELVNTAATAGTFFVILVTAIAAVVQLRHQRASNQLQVLLTILRMPNDPILNEAMDFTRARLGERLRDPEFRAGLEQPEPPDRSVHLELRVCDYYERLGSCVKLGLIREDLYFDNSSPEGFWQLLEPAIALYRRSRGPGAYDNFEYLVVRSRAWDERHPQGNYPANEARLTLSDPWLSP